MGTTFEVYVPACTDSGPCGHEKDGPAVATTNGAGERILVVEDEDAVWRLRHKVRVNSPVTFTPWQIRPYVAEEVFYDFNGERFNGNRVQTGLFIPLQEQIRLELFYFWHLSKEDNRHWS